jgi:hypothetical protein
MQHLVCPRGTFHRRCRFGRPLRRIFRIAARRRPVLRHPRRRGLRNLRSCLWMRRVMLAARPGAPPAGGPPSLSASERPTRGRSRTPDAVVLRLSPHHGTARATVQRRSQSCRVAQAVMLRPSRMPRMAAETLRAPSCTRRVVPTTMRRPSRDCGITKTVRHWLSRDRRTTTAIRHPPSRRRGTTTRFRRPPSCNPPVPSARFLPASRVARTGPAPRHLSSVTCGPSKAT